MTDQKEPTGDGTIPDLSALSSDDIKRLMKEGGERRRQDADDRRTLRGKYTPPTGKCRVCGGRVAAEIAFPHNGRIGGPPVQGRVGRWSCEECSVVYAKCPTEKP